ncbi:MAG: hydroxyacid dehydrogenase [Pseudomonadota bacterium]
MPDIVISEFMDEAALQPLRPRYSVLYDPGLVDDLDRLHAEIADAEAIIVRNRTQVRAPLLDAGPSLKCVGRLGVGLDNIDLDLCSSRGIEVYPATGANDRSVAEYVIATALSLRRGAFSASDQVSSGVWPREALVGGELTDTTFGLFGFGRIAQEVARLVSIFDVELIAYDPHLPENDPAWQRARKVDFENLITESDVLSLHVPLNDGTRGAIDVSALATMKPSAILINAARGGIVDEKAVVIALRNGKLGGAALDVFEKEPLDQEMGSKFGGVPNLVLTPHIAGLTREANARVSELTVENVLKHLRGRT